MGGSQHDPRRFCCCTEISCGNALFSCNRRFEIQTTPVSNISTETPLDTFTGLVRNIRTEIQDTVVMSLPTDKNICKNNQKDRSDNSNRYRSSMPGPRRNNVFSKIKQPNQPNKRNTAQNSNVQRKKSIVRSTENPKTTNGTKIPFHSVATKKKTSIVT